MSHAAGYYKIKTKESRTFDQTFTYKIDGTPVNLTGYSATMKVRPSSRSRQILLTLTAGSGLTLGGAAGTVRVKITGAQNSALGAGVFYYDIELLATNSDEIDFLEGQYEIKVGS